jgi:BASS family bile acid:Na+ symporter
MTVFSVSLALALLFTAVAVSTRWVRALHGLGFTFAVLAVGCLAVAHPPLFVAWGGFDLKRTIPPLVQLVLFGMGMTLTWGDFRRVLTMPRAIGVGMVLQYTILPAVSLGFVTLFGLTGGAAAGLILIGSVPGGTASNVVTYLARANVPLSISMTACSTLLSPFVTPVLMKLLAGTFLPIDALGMVRGILEMVIGPLVLGVLVHRHLPAVARAVTVVLPGVAMAAICLIVGITIAASRDDLLRVGLAIFGASIGMNLTGLALGYGSARWLGLNRTDARTVAIEVGMQNGGLATGLAFEVLKSPAAALGSAVFGPWSAIASSALASWWRQRVPGSGQPGGPEVPMPVARSSGEVAKP